MKDRRSGQQRSEALSSPWRAGGRILLATPYTVIFLQLQTAFLALDFRFARWSTQFFHRQWCRMFGIHVHVQGQISPHRPPLFVPTIFFGHHCPQLNFGRLVHC